MSKAWIAASFVCLFVASSLACAGEPTPSTTPPPEVAQALLAEKEAELKQLTAEIERLRDQADGDRQPFLVRVRFVDVDRARLRKLGLDLQAATSDSNGLVSTIDAADRKAFQGLLDALRANSVVVGTSEIDMITTAGRPATVDIGPSTEGKNSGNKKRGIVATVNVDSIGADRMRLQVDLSSHGSAASPGSAAADHAAQDDIAYDAHVVLEGEPGSAFLVQMRGPISGSPAAFGPSARVLTRFAVISAEPMKQTAAAVPAPKR